MKQQPGQVKLVQEEAKKKKDRLQPEAVNKSPKETADLESLTA